MNLLKLNRQYSIIIFFFNILVIFSVSKFLEIKNITIPYQTVICFFLISIIGVSHGALDHVKGSQLMKIYKVKNNFYLVAKPGKNVGRLRFELRTSRLKAGCSTAELATHSCIRYIRNYPFLR